MICLVRISRLRIISSFAAHIKYNLYSCLRLIPAYQRQHLRQAEQVVHKLRTVNADVRL